MYPGSVALSVAPQQIELEPEQKPTTSPRTLGDPSTFSIEAMADPKLRKRSRAACLSCQSRKRKCSGDQPCVTCTQSGTVCQFNPTPRKKPSSGAHRTNLSAPEEQQQQQQQQPENWPKTQTQTQTQPGPASIRTGTSDSAISPASYTHPNGPQPNDSRPDDSKPGSRSLEVNSGASFVRKLGLRIDPARAPRLHLFAWNVGERKKSPDRASFGTAASITQILSQAQMLGLAAIYFEKVHPCYAFLNRETLLSRIVRRWSNKSSAETDSPFETVLCGIAALAYLFSEREIMDIEIKLADDARLSLEKSVLCDKPPSIDTITAWVLRTAYLRMTASPHAAWMASCTLMHLIEAAGLHLEKSDQQPTIELGDSTTGNYTGLNNRDTSSNSDLDTRRRLFGMARHLNTWISFDLGRSRVVLHGAPSQPPTQAQTASGTGTETGTGTDLFHLLPLSESLDPTGPSPQDLPELEKALTSVLSPVYTEPSLILVQCNLMLCIYRRARALNPYAPLHADLQDRILVLASRALTAARKMVAASCPWHQVANVPFQIVCTLLAIDNRAAVGLLSDAMITLREVQAAYDTDVMREAYSTAYLLVALHQRRKEDDTRALAEVLRANASAAGDVSSSSGDGVGVQVGYDTTNGHGSAYARGNALAGASLHEDVRPAGQTSISQQMQLQQDAADADLSWLGDLMIDMPSLQNFDLERFLGTTVPWPLPEMGI